MKKIMVITLLFCVIHCFPITLKEIVDRSLYASAEGQAAYYRIKGLYQEALFHKKIFLPDIAGSGTFNAGTSILFEDYGTGDAAKYLTGTLSSEIMLIQTFSDGSRLSGGISGGISAGNFDNDLDPIYNSSLTNNFSVSYSKGFAGGGGYYRFKKELINALYNSAEKEGKNIKNTVSAVIVETLAAIREKQQFEIFSNAELAYKEAVCKKFAVSAGAGADTVIPHMESVLNYEIAAGDRRGNNRRLQYLKEYLFFITSGELAGQELSVNIYDVLMKIAVHIRENGEEKIVYCNDETEYYRNLVSDLDYCINYAPRMSFVMSYSPQPEFSFNRQSLSGSFNGLYGKKSSGDVAVYISLQLPQDGIVQQMIYNQQIKTKHKADMLMLLDVREKLKHNARRLKADIEITLTDISTSNGKIELLNKEFSCNQDIYSLGGISTVEILKRRTDFEYSVYENAQLYTSLAALIKEYAALVDIDLYSLLDVG